MSEDIGEEKFGSPAIVGSIVADDQQMIMYRPKLAKLTGSVTAAILLQQAMYWAKKHGNEFYKFIAPCQHELYKEGDSWLEELYFTRHQFNTAVKKIGFKRGKCQNELETEEEAYLIYYTDGERVTYWSVNWKKIERDLVRLYSENEDLFTETGNTKEMTKSGNTKEMPKSGNTKEMPKSANTIITETTAETTAESAATLENPDMGSEEPDRETLDEVIAEAENMKDPENLSIGKQASRLVQVYSRAFYAKFGKKALLSRKKDMSNLIKLVETLSYREVEKVILYVIEYWEDIKKKHDKLDGYPNLGLICTSGFFDMFRGRADERERQRETEEETGSRWGV